MTTIAALERKFERLYRSAFISQVSIKERFDSPVTLAKAAGIIPDPWQAELLTSRSRYILANCSRQSGKSMISACKAVWTATSQRNATVLFLAPSLRQSGENFRKCQQIYTRLHQPVPVVGESALRMELANGSRIISLPGKEETIRGISAVTLLILDEASRIPEELIVAARPMLATTQGTTLMMSTPFGARGVFYLAWKHREDWHYIEVPATMCPRISPEFLEREKRELGEWQYQQEYCCKFMGTISASFRAIDIERIISPEVEAWQFPPFIPSPE